MDENQKRAYSFIMEHSEIYAFLRLDTELEEQTIDDIEESLQKELKLYRKYPEILYKYYPSVDHLLDYILAIRKNLSASP